MIKFKKRYVLKRKSKYKSQKVISNGIKFDSKRECNGVANLKFLEKNGLIKDLKLQVKFEILEGYRNIDGTKVRPISYIADATYYDKDGSFHVVDFKGFKTDVYKIKKKMFEKRYKILIEEK